MKIVIVVDTEERDVYAYNEKETIDYDTVDFKKLTIDEIVNDFLT